jgi:hypothetical protein
VHDSASNILRKACHCSAHDAARTCSVLLARTALNMMSAGILTPARGVRRVSLVAVVVDALHQSVAECEHVHLVRHRTAGCGTAVSFGCLFVYRSTPVGKAFALRYLS